MPDGVQRDGDETLPLATDGDAISLAIRSGLLLWPSFSPDLWLRQGP